MSIPAADPHWRGWILAYFYLGGVAAGAYLLAGMAQLCDSRRHLPMIRTAHCLAAPLMAVCAALLVIDLDHPLRFWHMLVDPISGRAVFKPWSPMSLGSWMLLVFGLFTGWSFLCALADDCRPGLARFSKLHTRWRDTRLAGLGRCAGIACAFFIASYTGALLTATNQPVWSMSPLLAAVFCASAASTGAAAVTLAARLRGDAIPDVLWRWHRLEHWLLALEVATVLAWLYTIRSALPFLLRGSGAQLVAGATALLMLLPVLPERRQTELAVKPPASWRAVISLVAGLCLRYAVLWSAVAIR
jgi:formate-dependent nitrite reductase membrane component NrfD